MKVAAIVPVKLIESSKTRLELSRNQRIVLTELMLKYTILNLKKCKSITAVVAISADERVQHISHFYDINFIHSEEKGVNSAIEVGDNYCRENLFESNIIVPIDLIFINPREIELMLSLVRKHRRCSIIVPSGRMDGTNLLLRRPFDLYHTSYDNNSYYNHILSSIKAGVMTMIVKSVNLSEDLDTMDDYKRILSKPTNTLTRSMYRLRNVI